MTASVTRSTVLATWFAIFVVAIALWGIQLDYFPISQDVRPSWYVYGWPICFGTCSRDRFGFDSFSVTAAIFDSVTSFLMLTATYATTRHTVSTKRRESHRLFATVTGFATLFFVVFGGLHAVLSLFGYSPPLPEISEVAGNSRPNQRLQSPPILPGILTGAYAIGYSVWLSVAFAAECLYLDSKPKINEAQTGGTIE